MTGIFFLLIPVVHLFLSEPTGPQGPRLGASFAVTKAKIKRGKQGLLVPTVPGMAEALQAMLFLQFSHRGNDTTKLFGSFSCTELQEEAQQEDKVQLVVPERRASR
jgi:hypothetical protein